MTASTRNYHSDSPASGATRPELRHRNTDAVSEPLIMTSDKAATPAMTHRRDQLVQRSVNHRRVTSIVNDKCGGMRVQRVSRHGTKLVDVKKIDYPSEKSGAANSFLLLGGKNKRSGKYRKQFLSKLSAHFLFFSNSVA